MQKFSVWFIFVFFFSFLKKLHYFLLCMCASENHFQKSRALCSSLLNSCYLPIPIASIYRQQPCSIQEHLSWNKVCQISFVYVLERRNQSKHDYTEQYLRVSRKGALACFSVLITVGLSWSFCRGRIICTPSRLYQSIFFFSDPLSVSECYMDVFFSPLYNFYFCHVSK